MLLLSNLIDSCELIHFFALGWPLESAHLQLTSIKLTTRTFSYGSSHTNYWAYTRSYCSATRSTRLATPSRAITWTERISVHPRSFIINSSESTAYSYESIQAKYSIFYPNCIDANSSGSAAYLTRSASISDTKARTVSLHRWKKFYGWWWTICSSPKEA